MIPTVRRWAAVLRLLATDHDRQVEQLEAENQRLRTQLGTVTGERETFRIELARRPQRVA